MLAAPSAPGIVEPEFAVVFGGGKGLKVEGVEVFVRHHDEARGGGDVAQGGSEKCVVKLAADIAGYVERVAARYGDCAVAFDEGVQRR